MPAAHAQQKLTQVNPPAPLPGSLIDIIDLPTDSSDICTLPMQRFETFKGKVEYVADQSRNGEFWILLTCPLTFNSFLCPVALREKSL